MLAQSLQISQDETTELRERYSQTEEVVSVLSDPKFFSRVISLGIHQEIGTIHDEISRFLFDGETGSLVSRDSLRSELIDYRGYSGVRICSEESRILDPKVPGIRSLLHPHLSRNQMGELTQLVIFPEIVARLSALEGAELVSVRPWGINTVFGGFDPTRSYYEGSIWELVSVDALRYARLLENGQVVFLGTHDFISHIAGTRKEAWTELRERGRQVRVLLEDYFAGVPRPVPYSLVLPYALGILMDDLTQPLNYGSESRKFVIALLIDAIRSRRIEPHSRRFLLRYPPSYEKLIELARADRAEETKRNAPQLLESLIRELNQFSS